MDPHAIRLLIRAKLGDGRLPPDSAPKALGRPGSGEKCDACEEILRTAALMIEVYPLTKEPEAQRAVYHNRRRVRGAHGRRLMRRRGMYDERAFAHLYETGGMRRTHLRGHPNILKRLLIHARQGLLSDCSLVPRGMG
jgi:hypothetical protein